MTRGSPALPLTLPLHPSPSRSLYLSFRPPPATHRLGPRAAHGIRVHLRPPCSLPACLAPSASWAPVVGLGDTRSDILLLAPITCWFNRSQSSPSRTHPVSITLEHSPGLPVLPPLPMWLQRGPDESLLLSNSLGLSHTRMLTPAHKGTHTSVHTNRYTHACRCIHVGTRNRKYSFKHTHIDTHT